MQKLYVLPDAQGYIGVSYSGPDHPQAFEVEVPEDFDLAAQSCYRVVGSGVVLDPQRQSEIQAENAAAALAHLQSIQRQEAGLSAAALTFVHLSQEGAFDDAVVAQNAILFPDWAAGTAYQLNLMIRYEGDVYRCVQEHTAQPEWTPDLVPALWARVGDPAVEFPPWRQPLGGQDAYGAGDKVSHIGLHWISTVDANTWEPGVYGWVEA